MPKLFVYLLKSETTGARYYGLTGNISARLAAHNAGMNKSTVRDRPWRLVTLVQFSDEPTACRFERYLKSGSGRAFAREHLEETARSTRPNCRQRSE
jgi:predicted GIY-YIG superfamily endonuclease